jgi:tape measure domain-containing protein
MALNLGSIYYDLDVNTRGLTKAVSSARLYQQNINNIFDKTSNNIQVNMDRSTKTINNFSRSTQRSMDRASSSFNMLNRAVGTFISFDLGRRTLLMADSFSLLGDKVKVANRGMGDFNDTFSRLKKTSIDTGSALTSTVAGFQRLSFAKTTIGATSDEVLTLTDSYLKLGAVSGTLTHELESSMVQFAQGMISGTFQAQEFQSVVEAVPAIMDHIAKGMGISVGELIEMKRNGELLSNDVFRALLSQTEAINKEFEQMPVRMGRAWSGFKTNLQISLGRLDEVYGVTGDISSGIVDMGNKLKVVPEHFRAIVDLTSDFLSYHPKLVEFAKTWGVLALGGSALVASLSVIGFVLGAVLSPLGFITASLAGLYVYTKDTDELSSAWGGVKSAILGAYSAFDDFVKSMANSKYNGNIVEGLKALFSDINENFTVTTHKSGPLGYTGKSIIPPSLGDYVPDTGGVGPIQPKPPVLGDYTSPSDFVGPPTPELSFLDQAKKDLKDFMTLYDNKVKGMQKDLANPFTLATENTFGTQISSAFPTVEPGPLGQNSSVDSSDLNAPQLGDPMQDPRVLYEMEVYDFQAYLADEAASKKEEIEEKSFLQRTSLYKKFMDGMASFSKKSSENQLKADKENVQEQLDQASKHSKLFFDIKKAQSIATILADTPQAIASATAWAAPAGPIAAFAAGAVMAGAMGVQLAAAANTSFTPRAGGGDVFAGGAYKVNENGPEMFSFGGSDYLMTGNQNGRITPANDVGMKMGSNGNVVVNVYAPPGMNIRRTETEVNGGTNIDIMIEELDNRVAQGIYSGESRTSQALASTFGLNRSAGAQF